jgi:predicted acetyltransferase
MIAVRTSRRGEEDALADVATRAFKMHDPEAFYRYFREHTARGPADTIVAEIDGALAGHVTGLRLEMRFRGVDLPVRGLSAVAVLPEHRQQGVADRLIGEHLRRLRSKGEPLSLLYPFSVPFYQKHGYGIVEWVDTLRVPPRALPISPARRRVRSVELPRDRTALRTVYEAVRRRADGLLARDDFWWERRVLARAPERVLYTGADGGPEGYLLYEVPPAPPFPGQHLLVRELMAATPRALQGLIGFLHALGEQFQLVELLVPSGHANAVFASPALITADVHDFFKPCATVVSGAMARLVDVPAAFATHPAAGGARGRVGLDVLEPGAARPRAFDVTLTSAGARAAPGTRHRDRLKLSIDRLAQIYFAAASATRLLEYGHASGAPRAAELLDRAFAGPPLFLSRLNFF